MKTIFIPAKINLELDENKIKALKLKKNILIAYSIQYKEYAERVKQILSKDHNILGVIQVLGCSKPAIPSKTQEILLLSAGKFHGVSLSYETQLPVYVLEGNELKAITPEEVNILEKHRKASFARFLNSEKIGILVSTKPGQENLQKALSYKLKLEKDSKKKCYLFLGNNINFKEFENFRIDSWLNTGCPRLDFDSSVINIADIPN